MVRGDRVSKSEYIPRAMSSAKLMPSESFAPMTAKRMLPCDFGSVREVCLRRRADSAWTRLTLASPVFPAAYSRRTASTSALDFGSQNTWEAPYQRPTRPRTRPASSSAHLLPRGKTAQDAVHLPARLHLAEKFVGWHKDDDTFWRERSNVGDSLSKLVKLGNRVSGRNVERRIEMTSSRASPPCESDK